MNSENVQVIFVVDSLQSGGAERVVSLLSNRFVDEGYDVTIISKQIGTPFYELNPAILVWSPTKQINYKSSFKRLFSTIWVYCEIFSFLKNRSSALILPTATSTNGVLIIIGKLLKMRTIACEHNNYKAGLNSILNRVIKKYIYKLSDAVVVLTERDKLEFYGKYHDNVYVIPNLLSFNHLKHWESVDREPIILAIGNLEAWYRKGFDNLLKVYEMIIPNFPNWTLLIVGGGDSTYIMDLVVKMGLEANVKFVGERKDVKELMLRSEIFVLTSRWEGLPMVLIESMSQGLSCIAFDCYSGPRDIFTHDIDGVLVENQNIEDFKVALEGLMVNKRERERLANNALRSSMKYSSDNVIPMWLDLFKKLE